MHPSLVVTFPPHAFSFAPHSAVGFSVGYLNTYTYSRPTLLLAPLLTRLSASRAGVSSPSLPSHSDVGGSRSRLFVAGDLEGGCGSQPLLMNDDSPVLCLGSFRLEISCQGPWRLNSICPWKRGFYLKILGNLLVERGLI